MESKYHLSNDGVARVCKAIKRPCALQHFDSLEKAQEHFENIMIEKSLTKIRKTKTSDADEHSARIAKSYHHYCIEKRILHESTARGTDAELYYYNSPQGRLELKRRMSGNAFSDYIMIEKKINDKNFKPADLKESLNMSSIKEKIALGNNLLIKGKGDLEKINEKIISYNQLRDVNLKHAVIDISYNWIKDLSTEEQEAVSFSTSSGFYTVQYAAGFTNDSNKTFAISVLNDFVNPDKFYDEVKNNDYEMVEEKIEKARDSWAKNNYENYLKALRKSPKLETPIFVYRGTTIEEARELLNANSDTSLEEINELFKENLGKEVNQDSRLAKIPESTSVAPETAGRFGDDVVIEIFQKSNTSPAVVSAWGADEYEFLTNPNSKFIIKDSRMLKDDLDYPKLVIEIEEIR